MRPPCLIYLSQVQNNTGPQVRSISKVFDTRTCVFVYFCAGMYTRRQHTPRPCRFWILTEMQQVLWSQNDDTRDATTVPPVHRNAATGKGSTQCNAMPSCWINDRHNIPKSDPNTKQQGPVLSAAVTINTTGTISIVPILLIVQVLVLVLVLLLLLLCCCCCCCCCCCFAAAAAATTTACRVCTQQHEAHIAACVSLYSRFSSDSRRYPVPCTV